MVDADQLGHIRGTILIVPKLYLNATFCHLYVANTQYIYILVKIV